MPAFESLLRELRQEILTLAFDDDIETDLASITTLDNVFTPLTGLTHVLPSITTSHTISKRPSPPRKVSRHPFPKRLKHFAQYTTVLSTT